MANLTQALVGSTNYTVVSTDEKVAQTESTIDANYEVTFSGTASTATKTEGVGKSVGFRYNPSKKSVMEGYNTTASGTNSHAEGSEVNANQDSSHAEGAHTLASGAASHAEGTYSVASGMYAHAEGTYSTAKGDGSHAEGAVTSASGDYSHAEGIYSQASGDYAHAEGAYTTASGEASHAEGSYSRANGDYSHAEGNGCFASTQSAHAEGASTTASAPYSHAEGSATMASGNTSHAEGSDTVASNGFAHAEGYRSTASGNSSHAEGLQVKASGSSSHAEGRSTSASGQCSHAEGSGTTASGYGAHAEGSGTVASGLGSHAEGLSIIANHKSQHVFGEYNLADASTAAATARGNYVEIVGNGLSSTQLSNARTLDWSGNEWIGGKLTTSGVTVQSGTKDARIDYNRISINDIEDSHKSLWITSDDLIFPELQIEGEVYTNTWDGSNSSLKSALSDKVRKDQILYYEGGVQTRATKLLTGTMVTTFSAGVANIDFSLFNLTSRPEVLILTCQSQSCAMRYDFDSSSQKIKIILVGNSTSGAVRFCWLATVH